MRDDSYHENPPILRVNHLRLLEDYLEVSHLHPFFGATDIVGVVP